MDDKEKKKLAQESVFDEMPAKFAFWSGLVTGAAVLSVIAVIVMVTLMVKGISLTPSNDSDNDAKSNSNSAQVEDDEDEEEDEVANTNTDTAPDPTSGVVEASGKVDLDAAAHVKGEGNVAIVEFSDFQCPFCKRFNPTMEQVMEKYDGKVKHVYKHFPLSNIHPYAEMEAIASECASDQGKFWEMHDALFENQDTIKGKEQLVSIAGDLGLDTETFKSCLSDESKKAIVQKDASEGQSLGCTGTPCPLLVVDGEVKQQFRGAVPFETVDAALQEYVE